MSIYLSDRRVEFKAYPNGETIVPQLDPWRLEVWGTIPPVVRLHWTGDEDFLHLSLLRGYLKQSGIHKPVLFIDYMPYSRMDRAQDGHCFSLRWVAEQINAMYFDKVYVVEPHSQVTLELLRNSSPVWTTAKLTPKAMDMMAFNKETDYLVLPDDGAFRRYCEQVPELNECHVIVLRKQREFFSHNSRILGQQIDRRIMRGTHEHAPHHQALIIDDLCSRGGTFVGAADLLRRELDISHVALLVTHMEAGGLTGDLPKKLNRVFCTDTMEFRRPLPGNFELLPRSYWL